MKLKMETAGEIECNEESFAAFKQLVFSFQSSLPHHVS